MKSQLTDSKIKALKAKDSRYEAWHSTGTRGVGRLGVRVYPNGRKVFIFATQLNGVRKIHTIGDYPGVTFAQALAYSPTASTTTLASVADLFREYIADQKRTNKRGWKKKENRLNQVLNGGAIPPALEAQKVTTLHIREALAQFIRRGAVAGSNTARADLHACFNFALHADNNPATLGAAIRYGVTINPVTAIPKQIGAEKIGSRYLSWDELARLIKALTLPDTEKLIRPDCCRLLLLCLYTGGQRPWELMTNKHENISENILSIPEEISKTSNFHSVPLHAKALEIIAAQKRQNPRKAFLFPAGSKSGHLESSALGRQVRTLCAALNMKPFTPRDLRRTFKTLAGDMGFPLELRDILQNHRRPGVSGRVYDKYYYMREKREMLDAWNARLAEITQ